MSRMLVVFYLLALVSCSPDSPIGDFPFPIGGEPITTDSAVSVDTVAPPQQSGVYHDRLGVNFTWAADQRIDGDPTFASQAFRHVRFFQMMEKDYAGGTPATVVPQPCTDVDNPWSCPENSMRQHLVRLVKLRSMFPQGKIWIAPEVIQNKSWPCKGWSVEELGSDPEQAGYNYGRAALATFGTVGDVILAMTNEEWCTEPGRGDAYNEWRRGIIRAHRENPSCELAIGARSIRRKKWQGSQLVDNVEDVAPDVWEYIDETGGWADMHAHGIENNEFLSHKDAMHATDFRDLFSWSKWVSTKYPNIKKAVGEIAYTTSAPGKVATADHKQKDWPTYRKLIKRATSAADIVFLYQIEDHAIPEGAFSGSGIYPALMPNVEALSRDSIPVVND